MTKPTTAPPATSALVPLGEQGVTYNLDNYPIDRYNRLIPVQSVWMPGDLFVPAIHPVELDPVDDQGRSLDHYSSKDVPEGRRALTARALSKVASAASISFYDEHRTDDGSNPNVMAVSVMARMTLPTMAVITAPGSQLIDLRTWFGTTTSAAELAKFRKQFYANVATRARNRAIRGILSLKSSYTIAEIARPFVAVTFAPNMANPEVRARFLDAMAPAVAQLYGPAAAPQLQAGQILTMPEAPENDQLIDGQAQEVKEPSWFDSASPAEPDAPAGPSPTEHLVTVLREKAIRSGIVGGATEPQKASLRQIFTPLGLGATAAGLRIIFGLAELGHITGAQAQALIDVAVDAEFPDLWRALMAAEGAQAA